MELKAFIDQIDGIRKELGFTHHAAFFELILERLRSIEHDQSLQVDLYFSDGSNAVFASRIMTIEHPALSFRPLCDIETVRCREELHRAPVAVFISLATEEANGREQQKIWKAFCARAGDYAKVLWLTMHDSLQAPSEELGAITAKDKPVQVDTVRLNNLDEIPSVVLRAVDRHVNNWIANYKVLSLGPVIEQLKTIVLAEQQSLALRKLALNSEQERVRRAEGPSGSADLQSMVRNVLQRNLQDAERTYRLKYEEMSRPNVGDFAKLVEQESSSLRSDQVLKVDMAAKFETFETRIDDEFKSALCLKFKRVFRLEVDKDVLYVRQLINDSVTQLRDGLMRSSGVDFNVAQIVEPELDLKRLFESNFELSKNYKGEVTKPGVIEYFQALRDYTGIIMMIVGIVAPLTLISSPPDVDCKLEEGAPGYAQALESCIQKQGYLMTMIVRLSMQLKHVRSYIQLITLALVAFMIIYGFFDLKKRIPQKRRQEAETDLGHARDFVSEQGTRMFSEAVRDWVGLLGQYVKDYSAAIQQALDGALRAHALSSNEKLQERRKAFGLEQASVEHRMKNLSQVERSLDALVRRYQDVAARLMVTDVRKAV